MSDFREHEYLPPDPSKGFTEPMEEYIADVPGSSLPSTPLPVKENTPFVGNEEYLIALPPKVGKSDSPTEEII